MKPSYTAPMTQQLVEVELTSLAHDGRAVGRVSSDAPRQQVIFVQGGLPGQRVLVQITKAKKNFAEGICVEILQQAADFVPPKCIHAKDCGGCPLQAMPYERQLFWKQSMLTEALTRIGKVQNIPFTKMHPSPQLWGYRNKMEFAVGKNEDDELIIGLRAKASHHIIATEQCLLMPCGDILNKLQVLMSATGFEPWQDLEQELEQGLWRHVVIRKPNAMHAYHVQIITAEASAAERRVIAKLGQDLLDAGLNVVGFVHEERTSSTLYAQGELCVTELGQKYLQEQLGGVSYALGHNSFFQVNTQAAEHLCAQAQEMAALTGGEILWDIYCGVGAPSLGFAKKAKELYGVESNVQAITMARKNAEALGFTHCHYVVGTAENVMKHMANAPSKPAWPKPDVVIVDPPRAGMHLKVVQALLSAKPKRIVYLSCNPATLARDVAILAEHYELKCISAVDLFPHTAHVESCAQLVRKN